MVILCSLFALLALTTYALDTLFLLGYLALSLLLKSHPRQRLLLLVSHSLLEILPLSLSLGLLLLS